MEDIDVEDGKDEDYDPVKDENFDPNEQESDIEEIQMEDSNKKQNEIICKICKNQKFVDIFEVDNHMNQIHNHGLGLRCEKCKEKFHSTLGLNMHYQEKHGIERFNCGLCEKIFSFKHHLSRHMRALHSLECNKCFTNAFAGNFFQKQ